MKEIWKKISYSPDCEVSSEGNVRKVLGNGKYEYKRFHENNGHRHVSVSIQRDLAKYTTQVKRVALLVAEAFLYNPDNDRNVVYVNADASPIDSVKNIIWSPYRKLMNNGKIEHEILDRVCIDSIIYRDLDIACNVTGLNKDRLSKALDAGRSKFRGHTICWVYSGSHCIPRKWKRITITVDGVTYQNIRAAERALGLSRETLYRAYKNGKTEAKGHTITY